MLGRKKYKYPTENPGHISQEQFSSPGGYQIFRIARDNADHIRVIFYKLGRLEALLAIGGIIMMAMMGAMMARLFGMI